ncbi:hypothetical protein CYY_010225 [Polysphondylium violaceum]|uniref:Uncharacterized protein n=1 Tax=Polysphondylium violaceum TaxID=133409 RepID=A0A8J4PKY9_9MYCE|nr:hypothetical protein CYY_010225 [Polysphondylium violaceum]
MKDTQDYLTYIQHLGNDPHFQKIVRLLDEITNITIELLTTCSFTNNEKQLICFFIEQFNTLMNEFYIILFCK